MKSDCAKIIVIEWLDSKGVTHEWEFWDEVEALEPSKCVSVGFLVEETDTYKTIGQSISDTQVIGRTTGGPSDGVPVAVPMSLTTHAGSRGGFVPPTSDQFSLRAACS